LLQRYGAHMAVERSELRLVWPPALFATEAKALLAAGADDDALGGLLAEAFHGDRGEQLLQQVARTHPHRTWAVEEDPWASANGYSYPTPEPFADRATAELLAALADDADRLPRYKPRLLYRQRQRVIEPGVLTVAECKDKFASLIVDLTVLGYFEDAFGSQCPDSREDPDGQGQRVLAERLEVDLPLWPLRVRSNVFAGPAGVHKDWPDEVFFEVVEALDEVVARPRQRGWHDYHDGWDYSDYSRPPGQTVYRWKVNELLNRSEVPLQLAVTGSDAGLLVHTAGDPRDELLDQVLDAPTCADLGDVAHAVQLFRGRVATREAKRSAVVTLAGVLERRRKLLKAELLSKDEGALFFIANEFDLRHRTARQQGDYDDAFLDWVFWWYLGTVELTNRLVARHAD
jgi:hypothetical protein